MKQKIFKFMSKLILIALLFLLDFSCGFAALTNQATDIVFKKTLQSDAQIEVTKSENIYVPISKEEIEKRLKNLPSGAGILEAKGQYYYNFSLITGQHRQKIWSYLHFISPLANIPQQVTVFDVFLANKTVFILLRVNQQISLQTIIINDITNPVSKESEPIIEDFTSNGFFVASGKIIVGTNQIPKIELEHNDGKIHFWARKDEKWIESAHVIDEKTN